MLFFTERMVVILDQIANLNAIVGIILISISPLSGRLQFYTVWFKLHVVVIDIGVSCASI